MKREEFVRVFGGIFLERSEERGESLNGQRERERSLFCIQKGDFLTHKSRRPKSRPTHVHCSSKNLFFKSCFGERQAKCCCCTVDVEIAGVVVIVAAEDVADAVAVIVVVQEVENKGAALWPPLASEAAATSSSPHPAHIGGCLWSVPCARGAYGRQIPTLQKILLERG